MKMLGYEVDEFGILVNAPCSCPGCMDEGEVQEGHRYCNHVPSPLLQARDSGAIIARLELGSWFWQKKSAYDANVY